MMSWVFAGIAFSAAVVATFAPDIRRAILSLWVSGLGVGGLYLTIGAELIAVVQWVVSTLVAISFVFFAVMFGEYNDSERSSAPGRAVFVALASVVGSAFSAVVWLGAKGAPETSLEPPSAGGDLAALSQAVVQDNPLALQLLALTLFLVLVGGGVVARPGEGDLS